MKTQSGSVKAQLRKGYLSRDCSSLTQIPQWELPKPFDIRRTSSQEQALDSSGRIEDWREELEILVKIREELEIREKAKIRPHITGIIVSLWTSFAVVCIIRFAFTGDALPLVTPALLSGPLSIILMFYYGRTPPGNGGCP
jgi:hypothetical protein